MVTMNSNGNGHSTAPAQGNRMTSLQWYYHRLRAMDPAEVVGRVREKLRTRTEARDAGALAHVRVKDEPCPAPRLPSAGSAPPQLKVQLANDAKKVLAGSWSLYGWRDIQVSIPPTWHKDYAGEVEVPSQVRHLNHRSLPPGADARTIWEINRWAEMVRLAMHGRENGELSAITTAQAWLRDWVARNPMGHGINWTSALEGGLRLINFCWFDALVRDGEDAPTQRDSGILEAQRTLVDAIIPTHTWWVKRYASFGSSANNHRLGELTGLLLAVCRWPEMERFAGSAAELWREISHCVMAQFAGDGGNHEQALHYHLFAFEMALHACRAMKITDGPVMERLAVAAAFFSRMEISGEEPWDYGDSDDAQIVPLASCRAHAAGEWRAWLCGDVRGGSAAALRHWLGEPGALKAEAVMPAGQIWWSAKESGMAVGQIADWKVRLDASPLGFGKMAAHGHGDALHVSIWDGEEALIIDPGTGGYFGAKELRAELAAWEAHNSPQPAEGYKTPRRMGAFLLTQHHVRPGLTMDEAPRGLVKATLKHEGCRFSRTVRLVNAEDGEIQIRDDEAGGGEFRVRWHFAPECKVSMRSLPLTSGTAEVEIHRGDRRWQMSLRGVSLQAVLQEARASRNYGCVEICTVVEVHAAGALETVISRRAK